MSSIPISTLNTSEATLRNQRYPNTNNASTTHTYGLEANASGVSWSAVIAGAMTAAALSLALMALGVGLGFSAISPWSGEGASISSMSAAGIIWLIGMQVVAAAIGGYLAGRLRTKWAGVHTDEVFFRDTAHGFLVWAVGLVVTASLLASAASTLVGGVAKAGAAATGSAAVGIGGLALGNANNAEATAGLGSVTNYFVDTILRSEKRDDASVSATVNTALPSMSNDTAMRTEVMRIMLNGLGANGLSQADKTYLSQIVATKAGITQTAADQRINDVMAQIKANEMELKAAADAARKAAAKLSLWMFIGLLMGAFCASYAATIGGRQRDNDNVYA